MPKVGDRIIVEGAKVGGARREGTLVGTIGSLIKVRWSDESETIMAPAAGTIRFLPGIATARAAGQRGGKKTGKAPTKAPSKAPSKAPAKKVAPPKSKKR